MNRCDDVFDKDPEKCQCHGWCYADPRENTWPLVDIDNASPPQRVLGHHPSCMYWVKPPDSSLTGLAPLYDPDRMAKALLAFSEAYHELYWQLHPPKHPDEDLEEGVVKAPSTPAPTPSSEELLAVIRYIENIVDSEFCHDLDARLHASRTPDPTMTEAEVRLAQQKFSAIYQAVHATDPAHSCHHVHASWREKVRQKSQS